MKWDLFNWQQANELMEQAERIQRNLLEIAAASHYRAPIGRAGTWIPSINVVETSDTCWVITALPGAEANRLEVHLVGDELVIAGMRPLPTCCSEGKLTIWEIPPGRFERRLSLTSGARFTISETHFENGLLITQLKKGL